MKNKPRSLHFPNVACVPGTKMPQQPKRIGIDGSSYQDRRDFWWMLAPVFQAVCLTDAVAHRAQDRRHHSDKSSQICQPEKLKADALSLGCSYPLHDPDRTQKYVQYQVRALHSDVPDVLPCQESTFYTSVMVTCWLNKPEENPITCWSSLKDTLIFLKSQSAVAGLPCQDITAQMRRWIKAWAVGGVVRAMSDQPPFLQISKTRPLLRSSFYQGHKGVIGNPEYGSSGVV